LSVAQSSANRHSPRHRAAADFRRPSPAILGWFQWYINWYLRKNFHAIAMHGEPPVAASADEPLVVFANHSSWWDPLTAMWLCRRFFPGRTLYAPIDAEALASYPIFEKLGFYGVDQSHRRGAAAFLETSHAILATPGASIWITPEGRFCDDRDTSAEFRPGLAHLVEQMDRGIVLPLAMEYTFWEERAAEVLVKFGEPIDRAAASVQTKADWNHQLHQALRRTQAELADASLHRRTDEFTVVLGGRAGVGGIYEWIRKGAARLRGREYRAAHSNKLTNT
jgi:1-acyl-sn-glycerol-3-phosphate acyltransferase